MSFAVSAAAPWAQRALLVVVSASLAACGSMPGAGGGSASSAPTPASSPGFASAPNAVHGAAGCESLPMSDTKKMALGAMAGAVLGYVVGNATAGGNKGNSRSVGVLGGALVGALAGSAFKNEIDVEEQPDGSVKLKIPGSLMFASGRSNLSPAFQSTLNSVTTTIKKYCGVTVRAVGHTDSVGSLQANQALSEARAKAVTSHLASQGFDRTRLAAEGRGPNEPIASNADEAGRQQNRRVEVFVRPPAS